ncbi:MFS transporter [Roseomonas populi]|uniref:MFS transporter n=1 Tax=Roseomonas populi TaxID=3121582 RepID=A0ABT1XAM2_9PROT|nr:MFS transporter [Roseomonas pecuniae]MCR0985168.1 MFS transporter [Roseomonas pecuniae]
MLRAWRLARPLVDYLFLYIALYAGWGVLSPFLPAVLARQGGSAEEIGTLLAVAMVVRLIAVPAAGLVADRLGAPRLILMVLLLAAAGLSLGYGAAGGFTGLLLVSAAHAAATGPIGPLPDALAVPAAAAPGGRGFSYGWVRGAGAAAFVVGSTLAGLAAAGAGTPNVVLPLNAALFALAAAAVALLPSAGGGAVLAEAAGHPAGPAMTSAGRIRALLRISGIHWLLLAAGLITGSHALYTGFATLHWQAAGLSAGTIGMLWSISVAAEVAVFFLLGPFLLARLGPALLTALAAGAGALRWSVMAVTSWLPAMLLVQPLHGLTFAAQHLAAMAVIARLVPGHLAASAQTVYASLGTGLVSAVLTWASGLLYARWGGQGFWPMALLCAAAVPAALALQAELRRDSDTEEPAARAG